MHGYRMKGRTTIPMMNAVLFETISCPLCGDAGFEIVKPSRYGEGVSESELRQAYRASSNHKLLDQVVPPDVPAGLPSALLERRPDILTAEQQLRVANAQIGVATANYFPRIGLTALFGRASSPLSTLASGQSTIWSVAANLAGPIYQGGALKAEKRRSVAFWEETKLQYEQTAQVAFQDVSDALISRQKYESIRDQQAQAVRAYEESVKVSLQRYTAGKASYFEVLDAQLQLYPAENALALTELNRRAVIVQLYKALGGGWNLDDPAWVGPKS